MLGSVIRKIITTKSCQVPLKPSAADVKSMNLLADEFPGEIVFDSNRNGSFDIFAKTPGQQDARCLVSSPEHNIYPDPSPRGDSIVFARAQSTARDAAADIWLLSTDRSQPEKIASNGTFPTFSADGSYVYFERDRTRVIRVKVDGSEETQLFPAGKSFGDFLVVKPRISPDDSQVAFTSDKKGRWNVWCADLASGEARHLQKGCEPGWLAERELAIIRKRGLFGRTGIYRSTVNSTALEVLQDDGPPFGHEYFPTITPDGRYLLYAACPMSQHDHISSHYQLFIRDLSRAEPVRITFDTYTNRWPKLLVRQ